MRSTFHPITFINAALFYAGIKVAGNGLDDWRMWVLLVIMLVITVANRIAGQFDPNA